jgi:mannose-6-phosphate isomerase
MKKQVVKLEPEFRERIWGGEKIKTEFHGKTDIAPVGEMWVVAPFENVGDNYIPTLDTTIAKLYREQADWFNCDTPILPIRCTIIDPLSDLSVQVHPTEEYAKRVDNSLGKPEAWYIIDAKKDTKILYGHTAKTHEELTSMIHNKQWKELLSYIPTNNGDFLMVEAGDVHALGKDIVCFEISRAADLTYRVYDYDRKDKKTGKLRDLHIEKSLDVISVPHVRDNVTRGIAQEKDGYTLTTYIDEPGKFTMLKIDTKEASQFDYDRFYFLTAISGQGKVEGNPIIKGETYLVPQGYGSIKLEGDMELLVSTYRNAIE